MGCGGSRAKFEDDIKTVKISNGETIAYREESPEAPEKTLIFLHATGCSSGMLNTGGLLKRLIELYPTYRIIAPDFRGSGHSSYNKKISSLHDFAFDTNLFLDSLDIKQCVLLGTCLGGYVSGLVAIQKPERIEAVILVGALLPIGGAHMFAHEFPKTTEDVLKGGHYKLAKPMYEKKDVNEVKPFCEAFHPKTWVTCEGWEKLAQEIQMGKNIVETFYGEAHGNYSSKNNGFVDGTGELDKLKVKKVLIVHGEFDGAIPIQMARDTQKTIPDSQLVEIKGAGHFTWYDKLNETIDAIKGFLPPTKKA
jgi:pimeloyl-ACP methyl ester carboxylesterase